MRLQTQSASAPVYRGSWDCVAKTVKGEGVRALYKGRNRYIMYLMLVGLSISTVSVF